jgi:hypothetical protein
MSGRKEMFVIVIVPVLLPIAVNLNFALCSNTQSFESNCRNGSHHITLKIIINRLDLALMILLLLFLQKQSLAV